MTTMRYPHDKYNMNVGLVGHVPPVWSETTRRQLEEAKKEKIKNSFKNYPVNAQRNEENL